MNNIYFDNAATTQIDQSVIDLMNSIMSNHYGNPNSTHSFGRSSRTLIEKARKSIAPIAGSARERCLIWMSWVA